MSPTSMATWLNPTSLARFAMFPIIYSPGSFRHPANVWARRLPERHEAVVSFGCGYLLLQQRFHKAPRLLGRAPSLRARNAAPGGSVSLTDNAFRPILA